MSKDFDMCVKQGGRVRTKMMGKSRYMHICFDKMGKSHAGEMKVKKIKK